MFRVIVASAVTIVTVAGANFLSSDNYHLNATVGGYAVFNCYLDFPFGIEIPYLIEWYKEDEKIFSWNSMTEPWEAQYADTYNGRVQQLRQRELGLGRGSINLTSIRETDNGNYRCLVIFPNRVPSTRNNGTYYFLEVEGGNLITTPPMNVTCIEGDRTEFECMPKSPESIVKWYKDGDPISNLMDLSYRSVLASNGSLILEHTTMTDLGEYECRVTNGIGDVQSATAYLNVEYKAKIVYAPKERILAHGKPASLDCYYRANPPLTNLRWEKDGFLFDPYNVPGVFYSRNGSLLFNRADETHEGYYSCIPYNKLGTEGPSHKTHVMVQRPPTFTYRPQKVYLTKLGDSVTLACGASSHSGVSPVITWSRKDGAGMPSGRHSRADGNLTIDGVTEGDGGAYVCRVANEADAVTAETELVVENVAPRAPYNISATAAGTSIHVRWVPGYTRERVDYHVWYRPSGGSEWRTLKVVSPGSTEADVQQLRPGVEYEVRVLSQDYVGDGLLSKPLFIRTAGGIVPNTSNTHPSELADDNTVDAEEAALPSYMEPGPPTNVTARAIAEGVLLTWAPPHASGEHPQRYVVRCYLGPHHYLQASHETTNTYFLITDVREDEQYSFVVFSVMSDEAQYASERLTLWVPGAARVRVLAVVLASVLVAALVLGVALYLARDRLCAFKERLTSAAAPKFNGG